MTGPPVVRTGWPTGSVTGGLWVLLRFSSSGFLVCFSGAGAMLLREVISE